MYRTWVLMVSLQLIRCEAVVVTCEPTNKSRADPWSSSTRTPHDEVIRAALARPMASSSSSYWAQPPTPPLASSSCVSSTTTSDVGSTFSSHRARDRFGGLASIVELKAEAAAAAVPFDVLLLPLDFTISAVAHERSRHWRAMRNGVRMHCIARVRLI